MGYSDEDKMVRVDFFRMRENSQHEMIWEWYTTDAVKMEIWHGPSPAHPEGTTVTGSFRLAVERHDPRRDFKGYLAVCVEPFHKDAYPQAIIV